MADAPQIGALVAALGAGAGRGAPVTEAAAMALKDLARGNAANQVAIAEAGGIAPLVELVRGGSESAKEYAAGALKCLARNDANAVAIAAAGGIPPLVELVRSGSAGAKEKAVTALLNLTFENAANKVAIAAADGIAPLIELVRGGSAAAQKQAAAALANLARNDANAVAIAEAGGIPPLVELVRSGSEGAKAHAAGALMNLSYYNSASATTIAAAGGVAPLEQLARDGEGDAKTIAADALTNVRAGLAAQQKGKEEAAAARSERWKAERVAAGVDKHMPERPDDHSCPITYEVMTDPVTAGDGMTYERAAIEQCLRGSNRSPVTGAELPHKILNPNQALKSIIRDWEEQEHKRCMAIVQATQEGELQRRKRRKTAK